MFNLKSLVPVLALAAMALPAGASVATYCTDNYNSCGANSDSAFQNQITASDYSYASVTSLQFTGSLIDNGLEYMDSTTGVLFSSSSGFTISGGELVASSGAITITVPASDAGLNSVLALALIVSAPSNFVFTYLDSADDGAYIMSAGTPVDYLNSASGANWTVTLTPTSSTNLTIDSFNAAGIAAQQAPGGETPEVATFILIGSGLLAMRYMRRAQKRFFRTPQPAC